MLNNKQTRQLLKIASDVQHADLMQDENTVFIVLMRICRDYTGTGFPALQGEARDKWFLERLQKYRLKYFEKI